MQKIIKRLRIFAGPNGSGKSTLFNEFSKNYNTGYSVNADEIQKILETKGLIDLESFNINSTQKELEDFYLNENSISLLEKSKNEGFQINLSIKENFIVSHSKVINSYEASLIASFIRQKLYENKSSFCFETVMSHISKLDDINKAKSIGYKTYLYFVCIDDPEVNISRVENRIEKGGHAVDVIKIKERYHKTLANLFAAIEICEKAYLFDNSGENLTLIAEIYSASSLKLHVNEEDFPNWFKDYVLNYFI